MAATTVAAAAGLVAMTARFSVPEAAADAARADELRARARRLAEEDARAYAAVLSARRGPDDPGRRGRVAAALAEATDVPLAIAECAAEVGRLGARLARDGKPALRGDAVTGVLLADAAGRSAAHLVRLNVQLAGLPPDRVHRASACCEDLAASVRAAEAS